MCTPFSFARYQSAFESIQGMYSFHAALLMASYAQVSGEEYCRADTLEIGVHRGLSAILVAALRGDDARFVAIDLFEDMQGENVSNSGSGSKAHFLSHMSAYHGGSMDFMRVLPALSSSLTMEDLGINYSFCHVDGGHSDEETYGDLALCSKVLRPGGILVLDDYFNANFPGVSEGAIRFLHDDGKSKLWPLAIGYNKVIFQKRTEASLNGAFLQRFPMLPYTTARLWGETVLHFAADITPIIDIEQSTPQHIVARDSLTVRANLRPQVEGLAGRPGETLSVPILIENTSEIALCFNSQPIALSYHLTTAEGTVVYFNNRRQHFAEPLLPGHQRVVWLPVRCPESAGEFLVEADLVWEGICWFKDRGNEAPLLKLSVN